MKMSILSPAYNESEHLVAMIASVQAQTYSDFELLMVDDGSSDRTGAIMDQFSANDPRIVKVGDSRRMGKVAAFNLAFEHSEGDFVMLLAGDDLIPPDSIEMRMKSLLDHDPATRVVAFHRLRTFSEDKKFDGMVIPKAGRGNRSGGTLVMSRSLAELVFPIDPSLVSEDLWVGTLAESLAEAVIEDQSVVLSYRIHSGNSHPRQQDFATMNDSMHARYKVYECILENERFELADEDRRRLGALARLEDRRYRGRLWQVARLTELPILVRLRALSSATPILFSIRSKFYRFFSGWS